MSGMENFCIVISIIISGGFILISLGGAFGHYLEWRRIRKLTIPDKSETSDDFKEEFRNVIDAARAWHEVANCGVILKESEKVLEELKVSSSFASFVRYAHYAGYHVTFERNDCPWQEDAEYLDENVFKTDMREAADMREQHKWLSYKQYYDTPKSLRDRALEEKNRL